MLVLIAFELNSEDGAHSPPPAHTAAPTLPFLLAHPWLPSDGEVGSGDSGGHPPISIVQLPGDHTRRGVIKYSFLKWLPNSAVLTALLKQVARSVLHALFRKESDEETS